MSAFLVSQSHINLLVNADREASRSPVAALRACMISELPGYDAAPWGQP
jgi:hypothetical protein